MPGLGCFSDGELQAFLLGDLPQRVSQAVADHLVVCAACQALADQFDALTDAVICSLRQAHSPSGNNGDTMPGMAPDVSTGSATGSPASSSPWVAGYEILEELGRGGMSVVYKARHQHPARLVALKMILSGSHAGAERRARLLAEADAIARLRHPHVVQIYEVGEHEGLPFLVLEYVSGGSLARQLAGKPQPARHAAGLVETLARAIHHAHLHGIIHRDLKPANVLLTPDGQAKVSDFGLAKQERPELTATGAVLGTPSYMAPEQAAGNNRAVGPATDVYALGAILYEMLTGRPPVQGATVLETLEQIRTQEIVPPTRLQPRTPLDLETICLKCLAREPARRYATALELADDLQHFLEGKPIRARPVGLAERAWRWCRRRPGWAAMLGIVGVLLLVILIGGSVGIVRLNSALDQARAAERATQEQLYDSLVAQARGNCLSRRPGQRFASLEIVARAAELARRLELPPERLLPLRNAAILALSLPDLHVQQTVNAQPGPWEGIDFDEDLTTYAWMDVQGKCEVRRVADDQLLYSLATPIRPEEAQTGQGTLAPAKAVCPRLSRDGRFLAAWRRPNVLAHTGPLWLWRLSEGKEPELLLQELDVFLVSDFDRAGQHLALRYGNGDVNVYRLDPTQPARLVRHVPTGLLQRPEAVALHPTRPWLALAYDDPNLVQVLDYASGELLTTLLLLQNVGHLAWHPTDPILAISARHRGLIGVYDTVGLKLLQTLVPEGRDARLAFNPAGDRLAAYSTRWRVELFDLVTGKLLVVSSQSVTNRLMRFSRDGRWLTSGRHGDRAGIWEVADSRESRTLALPDDPVAGRVWGAISVWTDSRLLAVPIQDRYYFWDLQTGQKAGQLPDPSHWLGPFVPASPESSGALLAQGPRGLLRWPIQPRSGDPATLQIGPPQLLDAPLAHWTGCTPDGRFVVGASPHTGDFARFAGGWVLRADRPAPPLLHLEMGADCSHLAIHPNGTLVVIAPMPVGPNRVWDVREGSGGRPRLVKVLDTPAGQSSCFSPDGQWLAVSGESGSLYAVATWKRELRFVGWAQFSPDSRLLAVDTKKGFIRLIDIRTGRDLAWFEDPNQEMEGLHLFTPDGTRLIYHTPGRPDGIRVWDLRAIRRQLKALDLDWDAPDYPPELPPSQTPLRLEFVP